MLERGRAHPILGPVLLVVLVLLLAMVFVHAAHDGMDAATEVGAICFALASFFALALLDPLRRLQEGARVRTPGQRAPPTAPGAPLVPARIAAAPSSIPLRR
jgi:hypothetical protein